MCSLVGLYKSVVLNKCFAQKESPMRVNIYVGFVHTSDGRATHLELPGTGRKEEKGGVEGREIYERSNMCG